MSVPKGIEKQPEPVAPPSQAEAADAVASEDAESRKASRNFLIWWIGLPLLVMLLVVLLRDRV